MYLNLNVLICFGLLWLNAPGGFCSSMDVALEAFKDVTGPEAQDQLLC